MDRMLADLDFAKCYIDDIIVFSLTPENHMHHLWEVFKKLKNITLSFIQASAGSFILRWKYLGHMIYLSGLGVQKAKVEAIS